MTYQRWDYVFLLMSGLWGLIGVMLLAAGSHADPRLTSAGMFLLFHAATAIGLVHSGFMGPRMRLNVLLLLMVGSGVFAADICSRVMRGQGLLPNLAPTGGVLVMLGWAGVALAAALKLTAKKA
ncbi:hypothetical protein [Asticcacaulis sp.]|uniref:hypothetical protein n=1 Tax=Asticcacaulis sp. TaxID=1872648 RepID=UPI00261A3F53|nr:hypothetical protein [Asticcacaulis sp.]